MPSTPQMSVYVSTSSINSHSLFHPALLAGIATRRMLFGPPKDATRNVVVAMATVFPRATFLFTAVVHTLVTCSTISNGYTLCCCRSVLVHPKGKRYDI